MTHFTSDYARFITLNGWALSRDFCGTKTTIIIGIESLKIKKIKIVANWFLNRLVLLVGFYCFLSGWQAYKLGADLWIPGLYATAGLVLFIAMAFRTFKKNSKKVG